VVDPAESGRVLGPRRPRCVLACSHV
jgi:hypothetical protein